jgi:hypothetical protein
VKVNEPSHQEDVFMYQEEKDYVTVIIYKNSDHCQNGFGCSFNIMVP